MGTLYIVATPIGNLSDMTLRGLEVLKTVKYIAAEDTRHIKPLLNHYGIRNNSLISLHKFNESQKSSAILDKIENENCDIALVSDAGTPCISDPGSVLVAMARKRNIKVAGIPGACAVTLAVSISGMDVSNFAFLGFFPRESKKQKSLITLMRTTMIKSFVIYESPLRILNTVKYLHECFPNAYGIVANDLTKLFESTVSGNFPEIISALENNEHVTKGEYVIIIEPRYESEEIKQEITIEAQLINEMIMNNITMKEAIKNLSKNKKLTRDDIYKASLHLKNILQ